MKTRTLTDYMRERFQILTMTREEMEKKCKALSVKSLYALRETTDILHTEYCSKASLTEYHALFNAESLEEMKRENELSKKYRKVATRLAGHIILIDVYLGLKSSNTDRYAIRDISGRIVEKTWTRGRGYCTQVQGY